MPTVLYAWEMGTGLGHVMQFAQLARGLLKNGHRVVAIVKELKTARAAFASEVCLLPAPPTPPHPTIKRITESFAYLLGDYGFRDDETLGALTCAWRNLFEIVKPDLIIFDHSPTALLAARGLPARRVLIGMGYIVPPDRYPLPHVRPTSEVTEDELARGEDQILCRVNRLLKSWALPTLGRLGQLFSDVQQTYLMTFPELDPYARFRPPDARFWGAVVARGGASPHWPPGSGRKVYAYLRNFPALPELLDFLKGSGLPTLIYGDVDPLTRDRFTSPTLRFAGERLDPVRVAHECDVQIMTSGHGSVATVLLAGKPSLQLPLYQEQGLNARAVCKLGAGLDASIEDGKRVIQKLEQLLGSEQYAQGARRFAQRYAWFDPCRQHEEMLDRIEGLLRQR